MPELGALDHQASFKVHSINGTQSAPIQDFNAKSIRALSNADLRDINAVLKPHGELLAFWDYALRQPSMGHQARHLWSTRRTKARGRR